MDFEAPTLIYLSSVKFLGIGTWYISYRDCLCAYFILLEITLDVSNMFKVIVNAAYMIDQLGNIWRSWPKFFKSHVNVKIEIHSVQEGYIGDQGPITRSLQLP